MSQGLNRVQGIKPLGFNHAKLVRGFPSPSFACCFGNEIDQAPSHLTPLT